MPHRWKREESNTLVRLNNTDWVTIDYGLELAERALDVVIADHPDAPPSTRRRWDGYRESLIKTRLRVKARIRGEGAKHPEFDPRVLIPMTPREEPDDPTE